MRGNATWCGRTSRITRTWSGLGTHGSPEYFRDRKSMCSSAPSVVMRSTTPRTYRGRPRVRRIVAGDHHAWVAADVARLLPAVRRVEQDQVALHVDVDPQRHDVRRPVLVRRRQVREVLPLEQPDRLVGQHGHVVSAPSSVAPAPSAPVRAAASHRPDAGAPVSGSAPDCALGNAVTSRIASLPAMSITRRSTPIAIPPWGGAPNPSAVST